MKNRIIVALLVVGILAGVGAGYLAGLTNQPNLGLCKPWGSSQGSIPAGVTVTVSYEGNWRLSVAEFASNQTKASGLASVCYYEGSGRMSFYVSFANYQGWNTVLALAHKWGGTTGTLTVTVAAGPSTSSNSTASFYGNASASLSFLR